MECYVCTEVAYTLSPCKCKNLYLHQKCYEKLLAYENYKCNVCLTPFPIAVKDVEEAKEEPTRFTVPICKIKPIVCRRDLLLLHEVDIMLEPFRHIVLWYVLLCCIKLLFQPLPFTFVPGFDDVYFIIFSVIFYICIIFFVRGFVTNT